VETNGLTSWGVDTVEVGLIEGWDTMNGPINEPRFYALSILDAQVVDERLFANGASSGTATTVVDYQASGQMKASWSASGLAGSQVFSGHDTPIKHWRTGVETTHQCSRVDRTVYSYHRYRRVANGNWVTPGTGTIAYRVIPSGIAHETEIRWCNEGLQLVKVWLNSQLPTSTCDGN
jgi:hypothetical protein